jgi:hypothetical protein
MLGVVAHVYNLSYTGGIGKRITVHIWPGKKHETLKET